MRSLRHRVTKEEKKRRKRKYYFSNSSSNGQKGEETKQRLDWSSDRLAGKSTDCTALSKLKEAESERTYVPTTPHVTRSTSLQLLEGNAGVTAIIFIAGREIIISYFV